MNRETDPILEAALSLAQFGVSVHWLRPKSKAPLEESWPIAPTATPESLRKTYHRGYNVGLRPGEPSHVDDIFLHVLDVDVRGNAKATKEAYDWLDENWPEWRGFPVVQSGSGGDSRHVYFFMDRAYRSRKLARATWEVEYHGKKVWAWQIEIYGTGKQVAIPPSIHPLSGKTYRWLRPIDFEAVALGAAPMLNADRVRSWAPPPVEHHEDTDDASPKLGLTIDEGRKILAKLPLDEWCEDREGWYKTGMALHHEFGDEGYELWCEFSAQSDKFDAEDQKRVWKSFRVRPDSLRMATLMQAVHSIEIAESFDDITAEGDSPEDEKGEEKPATQGSNGDFLAPDIDELLGPASTEPTTPAKTSEPPLKWVSKLDLNEEGGIRPTLHNITLIVRNDPRTRNLMALNLFTMEIVQRGRPGHFKMRRESPKGTKQLAGSIWLLHDTVNGDLWTDEKDNAIRDVLEAPRRQGGYGLRITDRDLKAAVDLIARENAFHPIREYLDGLQWDGEKRLETMFVRYLGAPDNAYTRAVTRLMMLGAVTRVFEPGHKFDFAVILEGFQGKRKSTFISILAKRWFAELDGDFGDTKQMIELMQGAWVLEIPELQGFSRADVRAIKAFISRQHDKARLAYARRAQVFARQSIFIGSTNDQEYLRDDTGGRRFWPLECRVSEIDTESFEREVDQLWAETVREYRTLRAQQPGGTLPLYLTEQTAKKEALRLQESRRVETPEDSMAGQIADWLDRAVIDDSGFEDLINGPTQRNEVCLIEIWTECLGKDRAAYIQSQAPAQTLGRAMKKVPNWFNAGARKTEKYGRQRVYWRNGTH